MEVLGPGLIVLAALLYASWAASLAVIIDAARRPATDFAGMIEGRWFYTLAQGVFFAVFALEQVPAVSAALPWLGYLQIAGVPLAVIQQIAYLLRVVFPTRRRLDMRAEARGEAVDPGGVAGEGA